MQRLVFANCLRTGARASVTLSQYFLSARSRRVAAESRRLFGAAASRREAEAKKQSDPFTKSLDNSTGSLLSSLGRSHEDAKALTAVSDKPETRESKDKDSQHSGDAKGNGPSVESLEAVPVEDVPPPVRIHHFDTQRVVMNLKYAGHTRGQAETITTTIRDMLDEVVTEVADRSVPDSVAANEAYLFEAASSELRNDVQASRYAQRNTMRAGLARLQRDVEILQHQAGEMATLLKADMDMDINERKNAARLEENAVSLKLQELSNKINVKLASDLKSDIENLRWQITRRGVVAIVFVAFLMFYVTRMWKPDEQTATTRRQRESRGAEYSVPLLQPSVAGDEPEDLVVEDLEPPLISEQAAAAAAPKAAKAKAKAKATEPEPEPKPDDGSGSGN